MNRQERTPGEVQPAAANRGGRGKRVVFAHDFLPEPGPGLQVSMRRMKQTLTISCQGLKLQRRLILREFSLAWIIGIIGYNTGYILGIMEKNVETTTLQ